MRTPSRCDSRARLRKGASESPRLQNGQHWVETMDLVDKTMLPRLRHIAGKHQLAGRLARSRRRGTATFSTRRIHLNAVVRAGLSVLVCGTLRRSDAIVASQPPKPKIENRSKCGQLVDGQRNIDARDGVEAPKITRSCASCLADNFAMQSCIICSGVVNV